LTSEYCRLSESQTDPALSPGFSRSRHPHQSGLSNKHRDWRLFHALAEILMRRAGRLYGPTASEPELPHLAFALDSSIISLSLKLFPWGFFARSKQAALKLHLLLSLQGNVPAWGAITEPDFPDMKIMDRCPSGPDPSMSWIGPYLDFKRLRRIHRAGGFFVVRAKHHVRFSRRVSRPVAREKNLRAIKPSGSKPNGPANCLPNRCAASRSMTPNIKSPWCCSPIILRSNPKVIAELYRRRWQVELFFQMD